MSGSKHLMSTVKTAIFLSKYKTFQISFTFHRTKMVVLGESLD